MDTQRSNSGFTILELMITIALLAILLAAALPSFRGSIQNNRITTQANGLVTATQLARSEALKRGRPVSVCASDTSGGEEEPDCGTNWALGWMVFIDENAAGSNTVNVGERLRIWPPVTGDAEVTGGPSFIRYLPRGTVDGEAGTSLPFQMTMSIPDCTRDQVREIGINRSGRTNVERVECP